MAPREHISLPGLLLGSHDLGILPMGALEDLEDRFFYRQVARDDVIIPECVEDEGLYMVRSGSVRVELVLPAGRLLLTRIDPGHIFGTPLGTLPFPLRFVAGEPSGILFIGTQSLRTHVERHPETLKAINGYLYRLLHQSYETLALLALGDTEEKLKALLARLAKYEGHPTAMGMELELRYTQRDLAEMIGARRETVSRIMSKLAHSKELKRRGRRLVIPRSWLRFGACPPEPTGE